MTEVNKISLLQQYLDGSSATELEEKLSLKPIKGIPNCNFRYEKSMWKSEDEFWNFLNYARTSKNLKGQVTTFGSALAYYFVLVKYKGIYYIQVEVEDIHGDIVTRVYNSEDYQSCLKFAMAVMER